MRMILWVAVIIPEGFSISFLNYQAKQCISNSELSDRKSYNNVHSGNIQEYFCISEYRKQICVKDCNKKDFCNVIYCSIYSREETRKQLSDPTEICN